LAAKKIDSEVRKNAKKDALKELLKPEAIKLAEERVKQLQEAERQKQQEATAEKPNGLNDGVPPPVPEPKPEDKNPSPVRNLTLEQHTEDQLTKLVDNHPEFAPLLREYQDNDAHWSEQNRKHEEAEKEFTNIDNYFKIDFGLDGEYRSLYGKVISVKSADYTYELHPFEIVKQVGHSTVVLGHWKEWEFENTVQVYDKGEKCWGGPERSITISVMCGEEDSISDVREPSKCEYSLIFMTPSSCTIETVADLQQEIANLESY